MSITLNSLAEWIFRLRATRMAGEAGPRTRTNTGDDVTRLRNEHDDERRLLRKDGTVTRLSVAREQRDALRKLSNIL